MDIVLSVHVKESTREARYSVVVPDMFRKWFSALGVTDDPIFAYACNENVDISTEVQAIENEREGVAKELSDFLTEKILEEMRKNDTHNGYPKY